MAKNCNECGTKNQDLGVNVPYVVHESAMARSERTIKRQWIAIILLVCLLFGSFGLFVWYESQFETIDYSYDYSQDGQGTNIIVNNNEVDNGATVENKGKSEKKTQE